ncbi:MAG TPA: LacI family DNA-binding transcriptional regulator [Chthonomonadaceae bacterium]|nr:LacI family DNA-binding transcriptional regulator [Chthonomonadaceae bacterium]
MARRKSVTLNDIAQRLNVSTAVVSSVLNNPRNGVWVSKATRQNIVDLAKEMGYQPKTRPQPSARTGVLTGNVAILCLPWYDPLFGKTVSELCRTLGEWGFHPFIQVSPDKVASCQAARKLYQEGKADAVIMLGARYHAEELAVGSVPCVVIGEVPPELPMWRVSVHNRHGGRLVGEYLWRLGHRRVGTVTVAKAIFAEKEVAGFRAVWEEHGQELPASWELCLPEGWDARRLSEDLPAFLAAVEAQEGTPLTALFCTGDALAAPVVRCLKELGLGIPEEISVVGFDDSPMLAEFLDPPLTTVRQPFVQLGHVAAQLLQERLARPEAEPRQMLLPGELIVRASCAPPGGKALRSNQ